MAAVMRPSLPLLHRIVVVIVISDHDHHRVAVSLCIFCSVVGGTTCFSSTAALAGTVAVVGGAH
jgi:hypothetical protein